MPRTTDIDEVDLREARKKLVGSLLAPWSAGNRSGAGIAIPDKYRIDAAPGLGPYHSRLPLPVGGQGWSLHIRGHCFHGTNRLGFLESGAHPVRNPGHGAGDWGRNYRDSQEVRGVGDRHRNQSWLNMTHSFASDTRLWQHGLHQHHVVCGPQRQVEVQVFTRRPGMQVRRVDATGDVR